MTVTTMMIMMTICYRLTNMIEHNISDRHGGYKSTGQVTTSGSESKGETNIKQIN